jgi:hypothetical protein
MLITDSQPKLTELHRLMDEVDYPLTAQKLLNIASAKNFDSEVVGFYKMFPADMIFKTKDELEAKTEQLEILHTQAAPYEDTVHGAED